MDVKVSIIVPVYNSEKYLDKCITSILRQTFQDFELILIDDGSSDKSGLICDAYARGDERVIAVHIPNGGVSNARNTGIEISKGAYISFIDSDDYIGENYMEEFYESITESGAQLALCPVYYISQESMYRKGVEEASIDFNDIDEELFLEINSKYLLYAPYNKLYVSDIIRKNRLRFDRSISYGEDLIFNFNYFNHIDKISITDRTNYFYVQDNSQSLSKKYYRNKFETAKKIHFVMKDFFESKKLMDSQFRAFLYGRLFDDVYNSLFLINHPRFHRSITEKMTYLKSILKDEELDNCLEYADVSGYSKKVVVIIKSKSPVLFMLFNYCANAAGKLKVRW